MELESITLINGKVFSTLEINIVKIFMVNNEQAVTLVTTTDGNTIKIPFHSVLYWI